MHIGRLAFAVFVCSLAVFEQTSAQRNSFPAVISDIQARLVEVHRIPIGMTRSIPAHVVAWTSTCVFELAFQIEPKDTSFWRSLPFELVGHLPNGKIFQRSITDDSCGVENNGRIVSFVVRVESDRSGSAAFILTTWRADQQLEFYDYAIRTDQRSVYLDCSSRQ
jgi:hypothetical protein